MRLCLRCFHFSADGALYCGHCGLSLSCRLCPSSHRSGMGARFCGQCGSQQLTQPARSVSLRWLSRGLSILCLFVAWKWLRHHSAVAERFMATLFDWLLVHVVEVQPRTLECELFCWVSRLLLLLLVAVIVPGETGNGLRKLIYRLAVRVIKALLRLLLRITHAAARCLAAAIRWLVR